jgi:hypothetical protein
MANKRRITVKVQDEEEGPYERSPWSRGNNWSEWLRGSYLLIWYVVAMMTLDLFTVLQIKESLEWPMSLYASVLTMVVFVSIEYYFYRRYWGRGGKWIY